MNRASLTVLLFASFLASYEISAAAPTAETVLSKAKAQATKEGKKIFLTFDASFWRWCRRLDKFIETKKNKAILEKHFVLTKLVVMETEEKESLNNAGGEEVMERLGGKDAGLPFIVLLDANGGLIVNGLRPVAGKTEGENISYPFQPQEIEWFMKMLEKATPAMSCADRKTLEKWLKAQKE